VELALVLSPAPGILAEERCIQGSGGKPEGKRPLRRPRRRWEDNINMNLQEVGWGV
jgi:hypothetical protein